MLSSTVETVLPVLISDVVSHVPFWFWMKLGSWMSNFAIYCTILPLIIFFIIICGSQIIFIICGCLIDVPTVPFSYQLLLQSG